MRSGQKREPDGDPYNHQRASAPPRTEHPRERARHQGDHGKVGPRNRQHVRQACCAERVLGRRAGHRDAVPEQHGLQERAALPVHALHRAEERLPQRGQQPGRAACGAFVARLPAPDRARLLLAVRRARPLPCSGFERSPRANQVAEDRLLGRRRQQQRDPRTCRGAGAHHPAGPPAVRRGGGVLGDLYQPLAALLGGGTPQRSRLAPRGPSHPTAEDQAERHQYAPGREHGALRERDGGDTCCRPDRVCPPNCVVPRSGLGERATRPHSRRYPGGRRKRGPHTARLLMDGHVNALRPGRPAPHISWDRCRSPASGLRALRTAHSSRVPRRSPRRSPAPPRAAPRARPASRY